MSKVNDYHFVINCTDSRVQFSSDGKTWNNCGIPTGYVITRVIYAAGLYIAFNSTNANVYFTSTDLINWNSYSWPTGVNITDGAYYNGEFFFSGPSTTQFYTYAF